MNKSLACDKMNVKEAIRGVQPTSYQSDNLYLLMNPFAFSTFKSALWENDNGVLFTDPPRDMALSVLIFLKNMLGI
jgi:hypothetical protein